MGMQVVDVTCDPAEAAIRLKEERELRTYSPDTVIFATGNINFTG